MFGVQKHLCLMLRWVKIRYRHLALANLVEERDRSDEQGKSQIKIAEVQIEAAQDAALHPPTVVQPQFPFLPLFTELLSHKHPLHPPPWREPKELNLS